MTRSRLFLRKNVASKGHSLGIIAFHSLDLVVSELCSESKQEKGPKDSVADRVRKKGRVHRLHGSA